MPDTRNRAAQNRAIRQEALREQLSAQGHVQHVVDIADKLGNDDITSQDVTRLKAKADLHLALIKKYIPDLKAMELTGEGGEKLDTHWTIEVKGATDNGS